MDLLVIDLDGTITKSDNLIEFSFFMLQKKRRLRFLLFLPLFFMLKVKLINNFQFKTWYAYLILRKMQVNNLGAYSCEYLKTDSFQKTLNLDVVNFTNNQRNAEKVILTSNYHFIAQNIAESLTSTQVIAVNLEIVNGKYTGHIKGMIPFGREKVNVFNEFVKNKKYSVVILVNLIYIKSYKLRSLNTGGV